MTQASSADSASLPQPAHFAPAAIGGWPFASSLRAHFYNTFWPARDDVLQTSGSSPTVQVLHFDYCPRVASLAPSFALKKTKRSAGARGGLLLHCAHVRASVYVRSRFPHRGALRRHVLICQGWLLARGRSGDIRHSHHTGDTSSSACRSRVAF